MQGLYIYAVACIFRSEAGCCGQGPLVAPLQLIRLITGPSHSEWRLEVTSEAAEPWPRHARNKNGQYWTLA